jgi:hypothetical protein
MWASPGTGATSVCGIVPLLASGGVSIGGDVCACAMPIIKPALSAMAESFRIPLIFDTPSPDRIWRS